MGPGQQEPSSTTEVASALPPKIAAWASNSVLPIWTCCAQELSPEEAQYALREKRLRNIISGRTPILLYLEFLYSHNHADLVLLKNAKAAIEARNRYAGRGRRCCCRRAGRLPVFCASCLQAAPVRPRSSQPQTVCLHLACGTAWAAHGRRPLC